MYSAFRLLTIQTYGVSVSYAAQQIQLLLQINSGELVGFTFEGSGLPSISVGYESEDPESTATVEEVSL